MHQLYSYDAKIFYGCLSAQSPSQDPEIGREAVAEIYSCIESKIYEGKGYPITELYVGVP